MAVPEFPSPVRRKRGRQARCRGRGQETEECPRDGDTGSAVCLLNWILEFN